jgi:hypothetical protein
MEVPMRHHGTATSLSWIPSEAVEGVSKLGFESGITHYDVPPPDTVDGPAHLEALRADDRFRFVNRLDAWIDVDEDGRITGHGYADTAGGVMGATTVQAGPARLTFQAFAMPDVRHQPEVSGRRLAEIGPGALLGERAVVEGGRRTATLTAVTPCRLALAPPTSWTGRPWKWSARAIAGRTSRRAQ